MMHVDGMLLMRQTIELLKMARDKLIFLSQQPSFVISLRKIGTISNSKFQISKPGYSVQMIVTFPKVKVKKLVSKRKSLIANLKVKLLEVTSLIGNICSIVQVVLPSLLQMRFLQQDQIQVLSANPPTNLKNIFSRILCRSYNGGSAI